MLDSKGIVHVPRTIRIVVLVLLGAILLLALFITSYYMKLDNPADPKFSDWILVGMSLVHLSLTGFAAAVILFYTEKEVSTEELIKKTTYFLDVLLPQVLVKISANYELREAGCTVKNLGRNDIFGATYELVSGKNNIKLWVGLNVSRIIVIYWVDRPLNEDAVSYIDNLKATFQYTFGGASKVGYATNFEHAMSPLGKPIVSVWSSIKVPENLLLQPSERLFWLQDIAMMTESMWRTALRNKVQLSAEEPSPL
jgi:hypothetical protein